MKKDTWHYRWMNEARNSWRPMPKTYFDYWKLVGLTGLLHLLAGALIGMTFIVTMLIAAITTYPIHSPGLSPPALAIPCLVFWVGIGIVSLYHSGDFLKGNKLVHYEIFRLPEITYEEPLPNQPKASEKVAVDESWLL